MTKFENIIDKLLINQNSTPDFTQRNVFSKDEYKLLLDSVIETINENKDKDIKEIRQKLYEKSGLEQKLNDFFFNRKKSPGAVISFGTDKYQEKIVLGNMQEVTFDKNNNPVDSKIEMVENAIFDLASCTKLFTSTAILQLAGNGELKISDYITKYLPQFNNLGNHTIFDLLTYQPYCTEKRIDSAKSKEEAENILFNARPLSIRESYGKDRYNDISPMILKYIVEKVSGMSFEEYVEKNILTPGHMKNTFVKVPNNMIKNVANENFNYEVDEKGNISCRTFATPGVSSDLKAVLLGQPNGNLPGHAGIFSTCDDMTLFSKGLINGDILHPELTKEMSKNRTSSNLVITPQGIRYTPYYGFLCNSKHPNKFFCDMHQGLSGSSLSQSGFTGTQITIDPINKINLTFLSNRIHNRIISMKDNRRLTLIRRNNINRNNLIDSSQYGFERREITNACLGLAIQEKMLEEIFNIQEEDVKVRKLKPTS